ncbi:MFS transporter [Patescibacteria group bacterium]|nr:MFS transporter [Patescibacteria group bacterium]MCL5797334.1 MFS transporter [Patescibacteria group bacterium]
MIPFRGYFRWFLTSLSNRNYRLYYLGQLISTPGTYMQTVAQAWLILKLTHSGIALGITTAMQFVPILLFAPFGGLISDRYDKRKLIFITQSIFALQSLLLGYLVLTGSVKVWIVAVLAFSYGVVNMIDNPTRQVFVGEMVGKEKLKNALSLFSILVNISRVVGPALAGILIATKGIGVCFIVNAFSYTGILLALIFIKVEKVYFVQAAKSAREVKNQLFDGMRYIIANPIIRNSIIMMAIIGTLTYEFQVSLPLIVDFTFHGSASTYASLTAAQGIGAIIGGIYLAGQRRMESWMMVISALFFGISTLISAMMPTVTLTIVAILFVGFFYISFQSLGNTILQLECIPEMRGRIMAYWTMAFLGSTSIGGPLIGWIGQHIGPRWGLGIGGIAAVIAAVFGSVTLTNIKDVVRWKTIPSGYIKLNLSGIN